MNSNMIAVLSELTVVLKSDSLPCFELFSETKRSEIINKIETIMIGIMQSIAAKQAPKFSTISHSDWDNCFFDERVQLKPGGDIKKRVVDFGKPTSRPNFTRTLFLLSNVFKLVTKRQYCTRRELYYEHTAVFQSQHQVDSAMRAVCHLLEAPAWQLGVGATSKGLVAGPLTITLGDGQELDCNKPGGVLVPQSIAEAAEVRSCAKWILVVEKDAAFQKLLDDEGLARLGPCIFITGKGFPDVSTRLLVSLLSRRLAIPVLAIVDADPHGIEIMCVYRFGSLAMSRHSSDLACPAVRWLGIHPTDMRRLNMQTQRLTADDVRKAQHLLQRPYIKDNPSLKTQVQALLSAGVKAEVEGMAKFSQAYLIDAYIPQKIICKEFI